MLGKEAAEEKGWNGLERRRPCPGSGCVRGQWRREKGRFRRRGASGSLWLEMPPFPNPAMAALPGPGCVLRPHSAPGQLENQFN